jgi:hypothetical protein
MSSQSPYRDPESPSWQNKSQMDTSSPGSDQYPPSTPSAGFPQQPEYAVQQPYPPLSPQPVVGASPYHFCPQCGTRLTPDATSCSTCGKSILEQESHPTGEPAVLPVLSEHTAYGSDEQLAPTLPAQMLHGLASQQEYAPAPPQQPDTLPGASRAIPAYGVTTPPPYRPSHKGGQWKMPKRWRLFALIALIILLLGGSAPFLVLWLSAVLPAATATVAVTPASQHLTKTYTISAVTGTPDASQHQVQARLLSFTTKAQSKTVKATGQGHQDAAQAKGKVTISPSAGTIPAEYLRIPSNSGVKVTIDVTSSISSGSHTFDAWAENTGSSGNIPAYNIDASYQLVSDPNVNFYVQNTQAFTGGQDAHDYTYVQQSDIDDATSTMVSQLTPDAQTSLQQQVRTNEELVPSTMQCDPAIKSNHKALDKATDVMLTVTVTCKGEAYDQQATRTMATDLFGSDATSQLGANYVLVGNMVIGTPQVVTTDEKGVVTFDVSADGSWVYHFSDTQIQTFAQLISGKSFADAQALLLKQEGVKKVSIKTAGGWGSALPTSASDIKFTLVTVPGLQAQSTAQPTTQPTAQPTTQPTAQPTQPGVNTIGKAVQVGNTWVVTVNSVKTSPGSDYTKPKSGNIFVVVDITVKNISSSSQDVSSLLMFNLKDATGQQYTEAFTEFTNPPDGTVAPNSLLQGQLVYEVPSTDHSFTFTFQTDSTGGDIANWNVKV